MFHLSQGYEKEGRRSATTLREFIIRKRRLLYKELYQARIQEVTTGAQTRGCRRIAYTLQGGSTKKLIGSGEYVGPPTAVNSRQVPGEIMTNPEGVNATPDVRPTRHDVDEGDCSWWSELQNLSPHLASISLACLRGFPSWGVVWWI